jgi:hypothetical protein
MDRTGELAAGSEIATNKRLTAKPSPANEDPYGASRMVFFSPTTAPQQRLRSLQAHWSRPSTKRRWPLTFFRLAYETRRN